MQKVTVKRDALLAALRDNRKGHRKIFEEAVEGYRKRLIEELERRLDDVKNGRQISQYIGFEEPSDHTHDYDRVIRMAEMSIDDDIELSATDFSQFVMDDWAWRRDFITNASQYTANASL